MPPVNFILTPGGERDALLLEAQLVKELQFNVLLRDDSSFPYICVSWPRASSSSGSGGGSGAVGGDGTTVIHTASTAMQLPQVFSPPHKPVSPAGTDAAGVSGGARYARYFGPFTQQAQVQKVLSFFEDTFTCTERPSKLISADTLLSRDGRRAVVLLLLSVLILA